MGWAGLVLLMSGPGPTCVLGFRACSIHSNGCLVTARGQVCLSVAAGAAAQYGSKYHRSGSLCPPVGHMLSNKSNGHMRCGVGSCL